MIGIIVFVVVLSALSGWLHPWFDAPGPGGAALSAALGGLFGLALCWPLWWLHNRRRALAHDALKRWWQAVLLALAGAGCAGALTAFLGWIFGPWPALQALGGVAGVLAVTVGLWLGARGPQEWSALWAPAPPRGGAGRAKLLDTSVLIDGRIADLVKTGFIEGRLVLTQFVLQELHAVAESQEPLRRRKGRRGLDILGELQDSPLIQLETVDQDAPQHRDVDHKLIELAKALDADLLTTDFNLNKVAKVEGIKVLNINELANAIKPRFLPGEPLSVEVIDRGEEAGQGIGYLDDGTMVVVENGRPHIGKTVSAVVSSTLQTDAGKMLFVRLKPEARPRP